MNCVLLLLPAFSLAYASMPGEEEEPFKLIQMPYDSMEYTKFVQNATNRREPLSNIIHYLSKGERSAFHSVVRSKRVPNAFLKEICQNFVKFHPKDVLILEAAGKIFLDSGAIDEALDYLRQARSYGPLSNDSLYNYLLSLLHYKAGEFTSVETA